MNKWILIAGLTFVVSCQSSTMRGAYIDDELIHQVSVKKMNKDGVRSILGSPTLIPDYSPNKYYYVSRALKNRPWSDPKLVQQRIVEVTFEAELVDNVRILDSNSQLFTNISKDTTISRGTEENPVQTFVKNFGRFNKTKKGKRR